MKRPSFMRPKRPTLQRFGQKVASWPRYGYADECEVCERPLTAGARKFCSQECSLAYFRRMFTNVHWTKRLLIVRDGCVCKVCRKPFFSPLHQIGKVPLPEPAKLQLDHVIPMSDGGADEPANWQLICPPCHRIKSAREARERAARYRL